MTSVKATVGIVAVLLGLATVLVVIGATFFPIEPEIPRAPEALPAAAPTAIPIPMPAEVGVGGVHARQIAADIVAACVRTVVDEGRLKAERQRVPKPCPDRRMLVGWAREWDVERTDALFHAAAPTAGFVARNEALTEVCVKDAYTRTPVTCEVTTAGQVIVAFGKSIPGRY